MDQTAHCKEAGLPQESNLINYGDEKIEKNPKLRIYDVMILRTILIVIGQENATRLEQG